MPKSNQVVKTEGAIAFLIPTLSGVAAVSAMQGFQYTAGILSAIVAGLSGLKSFLSTTFADSNAAQQPISQPNLDAATKGKNSDGATNVAPPPSPKTD